MPLKRVILLDPEQLAKITEVRDRLKKAEDELERVSDDIIRSHKNISREYPWSVTIHGPFILVSRYER